MPSLPPLSILDLAPVVDGDSTRQALLNSIDLVTLADQLGYQRYWVAEHHNMEGVASSATAVLIGQLAAASSRIRVGSGGIMLPNHAPLADLVPGVCPSAPTQLGGGWHRLCA